MFYICFGQHLTQRVDNFLAGLADSRIADPCVSAWFTISERYCKENNLIWHQDFPAEHPISELGRLLAAVFIRHQSIGPLILDTIDRELSATTAEPMPKPFTDVIKTVYEAKWTLIKTRQQLNRSYKEVCAPMLEKCRFLLFEVRPAISAEQSALKRLNILYKPQRFRQVVRRIIYEMRAAKQVTTECAKPEDVFNVNKQHKSHAGRLHCSDSMHQSMSGCVGGEPEADTTQDEVALPHVASDTNLMIEKQHPAADVDEKAAQVIDFRGNTKKSDEKCVPAWRTVTASKTNINVARIQSHWDETSVSQMMALIVDFVIESTCDVETVRRAMYCQMQRYQMRKQGLLLFSNMCTATGLIESVQYALLSGYLGLFLTKDKQHYSATVLTHMNMITCFQKADLLLEHSKIIEWAMDRYRQNVNCFSREFTQTMAVDKNNSNIGTYVFLKKLPMARFLLNVLGILSKNIEAHEISLIINSGVIGCILSLLRQTGADMEPPKVRTECTFVCEDAAAKVSEIVEYHRKS